jgi:hypothetical protein
MMNTRPQHLQRKNVKSIEGRRIRRKNNNNNNNSKTTRSALFLFQFHKGTTLTYAKQIPGCYTRVRFYFIFPHLRHVFSMIHLLRSHNTTEEEGVKSCGCCW